MSPRTRTLLLHDLAVFVTALLTSLLTVNGPVGWDVLIAAVTTAVKVTLRQVLPVPPVPPIVVPAVAPPATPKP